MEANSKKMNMLLYMQDSLNFNIQFLDNVAKDVRKDFGRESAFFFCHTDETIIREMKKTYSGYGLKSEVHFLVLYFPHIKPSYIISKKYEDGKKLMGLPSIEVKRDRKDYVNNVSLPFTSEFFDFVMVNNGMTNELDLPKVADMIAESKKYLRKNGELNISLYYDCRIDYHHFVDFIKQKGLSNGLFYEQMNVHGFDIEGMEKDVPDAQPVGNISITLRNS